MSSPYRFDRPTPPPQSSKPSNSLSSSTPSPLKPPGMKKETSSPQLSPTLTPKSSTTTTSSALNSDGTLISTPSGFGSMSRVSANSVAKQLRKQSVNSSLNLVKTTTPTTSPINTPTTSTTSTTTPKPIVKPFNSEKADDTQTSFTTKKDSPVLSSSTPAALPSVLHRFKSHTTSSIPSNTSSTTTSNSPSPSPSPSLKPVPGAGFKKPTNLSASVGELPPPPSVPIHKRPTPTPPPSSFKSGNTSLNSSTSSLPSFSPSSSPSPSPIPSPSLTPQFSSSPGYSTPPLRPQPKKPPLPARGNSNGSLNNTTTTTTTTTASNNTFTTPTLKPVAKNTTTKTTTSINSSNVAKAKKLFLKSVIKEEIEEKSSDEDEPDSPRVNGNINNNKNSNITAASTTASTTSNGGGTTTTTNTNSTITKTNSNSEASSSTSTPTSTSSSTSNSPKLNSKSDMVQRTYLAQELLTTEKKYINNLNRIITIFLLPLRDKAQSKDKILSVDEINGIFLNIETIFGIHKTFLQDFEDRISKWSDTQKIGDVFLKMGHYLRAYTLYSNSYNNSMLSIQSLIKSNPSFSTFLSKCLLKPASKGLNLQAYLIMPIQRIPRYRLLLESILKYSPENHIDYKDLKDATDFISNIAIEVDERLLQYQIAHKVLDIQNSLVGLEEDIVKPTRTFLKEGDLKKISDRVVNTRHFFLFNDYLIYSKKEKKNAYRFKYSFPLLTCWVKDLPDTQRFKNLFQIISQKKTYFLCAPSSEEKLSWMKLLNEVINKLVEQNPDCQSQRFSIYEKRGSMTPQEILNTLEKSLPSNPIGNGDEVDPSTKPLWLKDQMTKACMHCNSSFTMTRRRHHCRKCGKIFCNDCCPVQDFSQYISGKKVRICKNCFEEISVQLSEMNQFEDNQQPRDLNSSADGNNSCDSQDSL